MLQLSFLPSWTISICNAIYTSFDTRLTNERNTHQSKLAMFFHMDGAYERVRPRGHPDEQSLFAYVCLQIVRAVRHYGCMYVHICLQMNVWKRYEPQSGRWCPFEKYPRPASRPFPHLFSSFRFFPFSFFFFFPCPASLVEKQTIRLAHMLEGYYLYLTVKWEPRTSAFATYCFIFAGVTHG